VVESPTVVTHMAYALYSSSAKLRTLILELLVAICNVSPVQGHKAVLSALSDYRIIFQESFRFETLIKFLRVPATQELITDEDAANLVVEEENIWDSRIACMALVNAIVSCPEILDDRILLRDEFSRRGINEATVVSRSACDVYHVV